MTALFGFPARAESELERLSKLPGFEVLERSPDGTEILSVGKGGVVFRKLPGEERVWSNDGSGHGAVLCVWMIQIDLVGYIDLCHAGQYAELRSDFLEDLDAINDFVVANSLSPVSKSRLEEIMAQRWLEMRGEEPALRCPRDATLMLESFGRQPRAERKASTAKLLSVPRPPVVNTCL